MANTVPIDVLNVLFGYVKYNDWMSVALTCKYWGYTAIKFFNKRYNNKQLKKDIILYADNKPMTSLRSLIDPILTNNYLYCLIKLTDESKQGDFMEFALRSIIYNMRQLINDHLGYKGLNIYCNILTTFDLDTENNIYYSLTKYRVNNRNAPYELIKLMTLGQKLQKISQDDKPVEIILSNELRFYCYTNKELGVRNMMIKGYNIADILLLDYYTDSQEDTDDELFKCKNGSDCSECEESWDLMGGSSSDDELKQ